MPDVPPIQLGRIPFFWRIRESCDDHSEVPEYLPFALSLDLFTGSIIRSDDIEVRKWLGRIYDFNSNIGYMHPDHALADRYGQDFLGFFDDVVALLPARPTRILDVGCGGCYILRALKEREYDVYGIDPSPVTVRYARRFGIPVRTGHYPLEHSFGVMDIVLSSGTLEHVQDPVAFLRGHHADLAPHGHVIVSVPDSGAFIDLGDPSMVLHEHKSYFTEASLRRTLLAAGFEVIHLKRAAYGASIHALARATHVPLSSFNTDAFTSEWNAFASRLEVALQRFTGYVRSVAADSRRSLGFYVPLRLLPYLGRLERVDGFRLFDDDPGLHGKFFDGVPIPVENFEDLKATPVTDLVILSLPHADAIARKVADALGDQIRIATLQSILKAEIDP
jgi:SAM-dependent methyltransferase